MALFDDPAYRSQMKHSLLEYYKLHQTEWPILPPGPKAPEIITSLWRELNTGMYGKSGINVDVYDVTTLLTHIQDLEKEITRLVCERNF
ncbi:hypothetical protein [Rhizobium phage RHph_X2_28B]|uniref:hypothetical protein n=1 Tax=Rhizobium phage RHph_X2_28B TaxID=2836086 RepID=UPI0023293E1A|nr:hypothetical protein PP751_gp101 [Rhizobium phage RHph_X2_28B]QWY83546.1 hypothetical protein [Rhizobium phage RHph_X2_28B]